jgi:hypothetical protein
VGCGLTYKYYNRLVRVAMDNCSSLLWPCRCKGEIKFYNINYYRFRQIKNFFSVLLLLRLNKLECLPLTKIKKNEHSSLFTQLQKERKKFIKLLAGPQHERSGKNITKPFLSVIYGFSY